MYDVSESPVHYKRFVVQTLHCKVHSKGTNTNLIEQICRIVRLTSAHKQI